MNCKQGDIAWVFNFNSIDYGKVVTCIRLALSSDLAGVGDFGLLWVTDRPLSWATKKNPFFELNLCPDSFLRPLRGDLSNDEIENPIIRETETWTQEVAA